MSEKLTKEEADGIVDQALDGADYGDHPLDLPKKESIVRVTHAYEDYPCGWSDSGSGFVALLDDGRWVVVWESSDSSGHGCQCSATCDYYATEEEALQLGIGQDDRARLKVVEA